MFYVYIVYKCSDDKMVILDNNYVLIKLDIIKIDIIIMIFKVIVIMVNFNMNFFEVYVIIWLWILNIRINKIIFIY